MLVNNIFFSAGLSICPEPAMQDLTMHSVVMELLPYMVDIPDMGLLPYMVDFPDMGLLPYLVDIPDMDTVLLAISRFTNFGIFSEVLILFLFSRKGKGRYRKKRQTSTNSIETATPAGDKKRISLSKIGLTRFEYWTQAVIFNCLSCPSNVLQNI